MIRQFTNILATYNSCLLTVGFRPVYFICKRRIVTIRTGNNVSKNVLEIFIEKNATR